MRASPRLSAIGLWFAGLAIGAKVVLGAFATAPLPTDGNTAYVGFGWQSFCSGSAFSGLESEQPGGGAALGLAVCPWCLVGGPALPALDPPSFLGVILFLLLLAFPIGVDRPRHQAPPAVGFASRAPPA